MKLAFHFSFSPPNELSKAGASGISFLFSVSSVTMNEFVPGSMNGMNSGPLLLVFMLCIVAIIVLFSLYRKSSILPCLLCKNNWNINNLLLLTTKVMTEKKSL